MPSNGGKKKDAEAAAPKPASVPSDTPPTEKDDAQLTCDVLCSLSGCSPPPDEDPCQEAISCEKAKKSGSGSSSRASCKSPQLPMFLSKTYHMIDRCDPDIATWSDTGDNFVVKNVEKFAATVLPQYFKHSNFSSFCRQLNFYGFRKLKAEPILTADFDARTACYVRFYHEKFQKDRPDLLKDIKRATKSDMQSRDDLDTLKSEVCKLKEHVNNITTDYDRKLAEMSYEYNRRITSLQAEYDRLALFMQQILQKHGEPVVMPTGPAVSVPFTAASGMGPDLRSLTQAATSLQNAVVAAPPPAAVSGEKRPSTNEAPTGGAPPKKRATQGE